MCGLYRAFLAARQLHIRETRAVPQCCAEVFSDDSPSAAAAAAAPQRQRRPAAALAAQAARRRRKTFQQLHERRAPGGIIGKAWKQPGDEAESQNSHLCCFRRPARVGCSWRPCAPRYDLFGLAKLATVRTQRGNAHLCATQACIQCRLRQRLDGVFEAERSALICAADEDGKRVISVHKRGFDESLNSFRSACFDLGEHHRVKRHAGGSRRLTKQHIAAPGCQRG